MNLPLQFADDTIYTVEFLVVPALNQTIILGMTFLHTLNPSIDWKTHTITWDHPQLTSVTPLVVPTAPLDYTAQSAITAIFSSEQFVQAFQTAGT